LPSIERGAEVTIVKRALGAIFLLATLALYGCGHKLVAHNGETSVNVFQNKENFDKLQSLKSQGGPAGMIGGFGESMMTRKIPENTPVKIISSDPEGDVIEVTQGPDKGLRGYVSKDNVN
jgi:hypothetical protein